MVIGSEIDGRRGQRSSAGELVPVVVPMGRAVKIRFIWTPMGERIAKQMPMILSLNCDKSM